MIRFEVDWTRRRPVAGGLSVDREDCISGKEQTRVESGNGKLRALFPHTDCIRFVSFRFVSNRNRYEKLDWKEERRSTKLKQVQRSDLVVGPIDLGKQSDQKRLNFQWDCCSIILHNGLVHFIVPHSKRNKTHGETEREQWSNGRSFLSTRNWIRFETMLSTYSE
jgi:hypothetical protein